MLTLLHIALAGHQYAIYLRCCILLNMKTVLIKIIVSFGSAFTANVQSDYSGDCRVVEQITSGLL